MHTGPGMHMALLRWQEEDTLSHHSHKLDSESDQHSDLFPSRKKDNDSSTCHDLMINRTKCCFQLVASCRRCISPMIRSLRRTIFRVCTPAKLRAIQRSAASCGRMPQLVRDLHCVLWHFLLHLDEKSVKIRRLWWMACVRILLSRSSIDARIVWVFLRLNPHASSCLNMHPLLSTSLGDLSVSVLTRSSERHQRNFASILRCVKPTSFSHDLKSTTMESYFHSQPWPLLLLLLCRGPLSVLCLDVLDTVNRQDPSVIAARLILACCSACTGSRSALIRCFREPTTTISARQLKYSLLLQVESVRTAIRSPHSSPLLSLLKVPSVLAGIACGPNVLTLQWCVICIRWHQTLPTWLTTTSTILPLGAPLGEVEDNIASLVLQEESPLALIAGIRSSAFTVSHFSHPTAAGLAFWNCCVMLPCLVTPPW